MCPYRYHISGDFDTFSAHISICYHTFDSGGLDNCVKLWDTAGLEEEGIKLAQTSQEWCARRLCVE